MERYDAVNRYDRFDWFPGERIIVGVMKFQRHRSGLARNNDLRFQRDRERRVADSMQLVISKHGSA